MTSVLGNHFLGDLGPVLEDQVHDLLCTHFDGVGLFNGGWTVEDGDNGVLVWVERLGDTTLIELEAPAFAGLRCATSLIEEALRSTGRTIGNGGLLVEKTPDGRSNVAMTTHLAADPLDAPALVAAVARILDDVASLKHAAAA
ncbi:hypothetical protein [Nocardioides bruguierae]|uniref:YbjN domain-containing protein n=1 Tax=Nocardioides bruguierae TaxID=2945102 RepID=A0A9X2D6Q8_9ACTN|nr:hypothetical protein [Nocardioides bruguierae]MCL8024000.1 hypothetical protein [Nocardioides bruguierae]MCM0620336.1 hypothetical protein [Nocardioides bruguierae]